VHEKRKSLWELNIAVLLWAGTALFAKWISLPAHQITGLRSVVATGALLALLLARGDALGVRGRRDLAVLIASGLALAGHWITYFHSIKMSTVAVGILALHAYPVITALVEPLWFKEKLHLFDVGLAGVVGMGLAVLVPDFSPGSPILQGTLWGLLSAALFTVRNLLTRQITSVYGGTKVTFYQLAVSATVLLPTSLTLGEPVGVSSGLKLALLGVLFTALPHTLYTNALQQLSARSAAMLATLLPVYGALSAALLLGEIPSVRTFAGGAIILAAVTVETRRALRRQ
jgi:drug/metabolite transporter (DMT)-like permease